MHQPNREVTEVRSALVAADRSERTEWFGQARNFLKEHPDSTLFAVVQHLWPNFLMLPEQRRAYNWFWLKTQFESLGNRGWLMSRIAEDGVTTWSLTRRAQQLDENKGSKAA